MHSFVLMSIMESRSHLSSHGEQIKDLKMRNVRAGSWLVAELPITVILYEVCIGLTLTSIIINDIGQRS